MYYDMECANRDNLTVGEMVTKFPSLCVTDDCPVETVLVMMNHASSRIVAVVSPGHVFHGLVNKSSLLGGLMLGQNFDVGQPVDTTRFKTLHARDVMVPAPAFLASEIDLCDALEIMAEYGYQTMPVLRENAYFVGIADMRLLMELCSGGGHWAEDPILAFLAWPGHGPAQKTTQAARPRP